MKRITLTHRLRKLLNRSSSKSWQRFLASISGIGMAGAGTLAHADTSTTLTGLPGGPPFNQNVPVNHGSNAEVTLTWDTDFDQYGTAEYAGGWNGRGNVYQMEYTFQTIKFTPTNRRVAIEIQDVVLDEWELGGNTFSHWSVTGSKSGLLASGTWDDFNNANDPADAGGRSTVAINAMGVNGEQLVLEFNNPDSLSGGGFDSYLAMDNLVFHTSLVPEPTTALMAWMGIAGLGAMAMRRKRS
jgi:hypothetical protein